MSVVSYSTWTTTQLEEKFGTSSQRGLATIRVKLLQEEMKRPDSGPLLWPSLLQRQFNQPFIYLLLAIAAVSFFAESKINALIIIAIVIFNALLSFYQEYRAVQSLERIKEQLKHHCIVIREGVAQYIPDGDLVVGDLIRLDPGNIVPADVRLINGALSIDEALLTGESNPVFKESVPLDVLPETLYQATNIAFYGTTVTSGTALGFVLSLNNDTELGKVEAVTMQTMQQSGFQERIRKLSYFLLTIIGCTLLSLILVHLLIQGMAINIVELILFSVALVVGLVPEALPAVTTLSLSRGAALLARHNVLVKRLSAIEDLGAITLLCTDKTGTLTENNLTPISWFPQSGELALYAHLMALRPESDPFDEALYVPSKTHKALGYTLDKDEPFDPQKRVSALLVEKDGYTLALLRGALEDIQSRCSSFHYTQEFASWLSEQAKEGTRVLAFAYKNQGYLDDTDFIFAGCIAFSDEIKKTAVQAIHKALALQVVIKMVTGDSKEVGNHIGKMIGLIESDQEIISGSDFERMTPTQQKNAAQQFAVFARFLPQQKERLVNLLREEYVVGFLGDGINDAPALKAAHVGIVVQKASDVTKAASDIILLQKSLLVVVNGIAIGRRILLNTIKYLTSSIASNFGNFYSIALASLFIDFLPLLPRQILLIAFLSDLPMISIATDTVDIHELRSPPRFDMRSITLIATILGLVSSVFDFIFFSFFFHAREELLQTLWFIESILTEIVLIFSIRTKHFFLHASRPSATLIMLSILVVAITMSLPFFSIGDHMFSFTQYSFQDGLIICLIVAAYFMTTELVKLSYYKSMKP